MMADNELLQAISDLLDKKLKSELQPIKEDISSLKQSFRDLEDSVTDLKLHLENVTDKNISLLAENYSNLVRKLDENNKVTDTQLAYQIKVNSLMEDVKILKKEIEKLKNKIA